jgi:hypothetical protein
MKLAGTGWVLSDPSRSMPQASVLLEGISTECTQKKMGRLSRGGPSSRRLLRFVWMDLNLTRRYCTVSCRLSGTVVLPLVAVRGTV